MSRQRRGTPRRAARPGDLRAVVALGAAAAVVAGLFLAHYHGAWFAWIAVEAMVVLVAVLAERNGRYRGEGPEAPDGEWEPTAEVFDDPVTGERLRVSHNRRTGARRYAPEERSGPAQRS